MKRISIFVVLICAFLLAFSGVAYASFGVHGGYAMDTDACAGCHRAHTSFSDITWTDYTDDQNVRSALLVSSARTMSDFCNTCHGNDAPGASTNVMGGVFDSGPSASWDGINNYSGDDDEGIAKLYDTNSTFGAQLNGGGFLFLGGNPDNLITSVHNMEGGPLTDPMWGGGLAWQPMGTNLTCTDCHDPHGSSNYRILKDTVNNQRVGGYTSQGAPDPWVVSNEENYPLQGWNRGPLGAAQTADYVPNYTEPEYGYLGPANGEMRSMSGWCAACHVNYHAPKDPGFVRGTWSYPPNYGTQYATSAAWPDGVVADGTAKAGTVAKDYEAGVGLQGRHRHPVGVTLGAGVPSDSTGEMALALPVILNEDLPLEAVPANYDRGDWGFDSYISCLTCHYAHGTDVTMSGWATARLEETEMEVIGSDTFIWQEEGQADLVLTFDEVVGVGWCGWMPTSTDDVWIPVPYDAGDCYEPVIYFSETAGWVWLDESEDPAVEVAIDPDDPTTWPPDLGTGFISDPDYAYAHGKAGVNPNFSSSLLRLNNRGVCQGCHFK